MPAETWAAILFWAVALAASLLYGWAAIDIHSGPRRKPTKSAEQKVDDEKATSGTKGEPTDELVYSCAWRWHQRWLNFLGALVGWLALWFLGRKYVDCVFATCEASPSAWDVVAALIAFVGITGFLPGTVVTFLSSFSGLAAKLAELLAAWVTKLK